MTKLRKSQIFKIAALIFILLVLISAGCKKNSKPKNAGKEESKKNNETAPTKSVLPHVPRDAVIFAMKAQLKAMPFRVSSETTGSSGTKLKTSVVFESPERVSIKSPTGVAVLYDGKFYIKEGDATWREDPNAASIIKGFLDTMKEDGVKKVIATIKTVKQVGDEEIDGTSCRVYEYTHSGKQFGVQTSGKVRLWVAEKDGLPIKQEAEGTTAGYSAKTKQSIDYGPNNQVEEPSTK